MKPVFAFCLLFSIGSLAWPVAARAAERHRDIPVAVMEDKVRGGLLGEILGDLNGLKHEMKYIAEPGNVQAYVPELPQGAWTDDDTDIEWVYVLEIQRSKLMLLSPQRIGDLWKRHINRGIWCSHQYLRQLMEIGIEPPLTGKVSLNPWADFNLSGQFVSETWGMISPGLPQTAAHLSLYYTHVSIEGEPSQSAQAFAAMIATAYLTSDMETILDAGQAALDPKSEFSRMMRDVRRWHRENPGDWRATRKLIRDNYAHYGGQDMRDRNGAILNGAGTIAALLYGKGDYVETVRNAFNFGWDADNNAATAGTIVGVMKGYRWMLAQGWPIVDRYKNTTRENMPNDETITSFADRLIDLAEKVIVEQGGKRLTKNGGVFYRINAQEPKCIQRMGSPDEQTGALKERLKDEITRGITRPASNQESARAAYYAICLDIAPPLRQEHPRQWSDAVAALSRCGNIVQAIFHHSPTPLGDTLRQKALAAGLQRPSTRADLW